MKSRCIQFLEASSFTSNASLFLFLVCLIFFFRYVLLLFILFFIPGVMMIVAYGLISRELYRGIQFELGQNTENTGEIIKIQTALKGS